MISTITEILNNKKQPIEPHRNYIGASSIGNNCSRALWYAYHDIERIPMDARRKRTLNIGKNLEVMLIREMVEAGMILQVGSEDLSNLSLNQFQGHVDAIWKNPPHAKEAIIEIKTAKDSSFRVFQKNGLKRWYPIYYAQVQAYMGMSGIHNAYVIALNKDTSELHDEHINFLPFYYEKLVEKAKTITELDSPPARVNESPLFYQCKTCDFRKTCHNHDN